MAALSPSEIVPGTVVQLDVDPLRTTGLCRTNAEAKDGEDRAVQGEHSFLIVATDDEENLATLVPVFSAWAPGSEQLKEYLKSGHQDLWAGVPLFFNKWQHWEIPISEVASFSNVEDTTAGSRRHYALDDPDELDRILDFSNRNRAPWRRLS